jgi:hypothetical protein
MLYDIFAEIDELSLTRLAAMIHTAIVGTRSRRKTQN